mmetsp:Transcript_13825/g.33377  ORF Transcript_13825/g.33377 Transcript_13825/m.33377 type:complete len:240 (+) Transcript_13825:601-1320(+)
MVERRAARCARLMSCADLGAARILTHPLGPEISALQPIPTRRNFASRFLTMTRPRSLPPAARRELSWICASACRCSAVQPPSCPTPSLPTRCEATCLERGLGTSARTAILWTGRRAAKRGSSAHAVTTGSLRSTRDARRLISARATCAGPMVIASTKRSTMPAIATTASRRLPQARDTRSASKSTNVSRIMGLRSAGKRRVRAPARMVSTGTRACAARATRPRNPSPAERDVLRRSVAL